MSPLLMRAERDVDVGRGFQKNLLITTVPYINSKESFLWVGFHLIAIGTWMNTARDVCRIV